MYVFTYLHLYHTLMLLQKNLDHNLTKKMLTPNKDETSQHNITPIKNINGDFIMKVNHTKPDTNKQNEHFTNLENTM